MASPKFISFCFLVLFVSSYGITCCLSDIRHPKEHAAALFVFGDSLFDVGNNNYSNTTADNQANYSPYEKTNYGRFSDGRVIPDFIGKYAKLPLSPPYLFPGFQGYVHGVIFASAGAGPLVETHQGVVCFSLTENSSVFTAEKYVDMVVGNLTTVIKGIHKKGGRKFGVLNQSVLGCIPLVKAPVNGSEGSCVEEASALAKLHNSVLSVELEKRDYSFGGKRTVKDYELCENPRDYVFFDSIHPTERVDQIISQLIMWSGNQRITGPYNLKTLFEE
uniref:Uncharacterized protein n=1 Tax=Glycine max TaxID=3847 RepID=A0A0R0FWM5_SOYBN